MRFAPLLLLCAVVPARADYPAPRLELQAPTDGTIAANEPLVLLGNTLVNPRLTVDGKALAVEVESWKDLAPEPATQTWYLVRPKGGAWPRGKKIVLRAASVPPVEAALGEGPDSTPPALPRFGDAQVVTRDYPMFGTRTFVQLAHDKLDDRSPALRLTLRLRAPGPARGKPVEVTTVLVANHPGMIVLPEGTPTCVQGGTVTDPAGNATAIPPAACKQ